MYSLLRDDQLFERCDPHIPFDANDMVNGYAPEFRGSFNLNWEHPYNPTDVAAYAQAVTVPAKICKYKKPMADAVFPQVPAINIEEPEFVSILPLLIAARHHNVDIHQYHIVSERNSFRKIAMNNEDYVISVQKFRETLFLRRHDERNNNRSSIGHRFERLCTPTYDMNASYYQLVEGTIGNLRTLISAETDAVFDHEDPVELKCSYSNHLADDRRSDVWLQAFLSGVKRIIFGQYSETVYATRLKGEIQNISVETLIEEIVKDTLISTLHRVLQFLSERVNENQVYLLSRRFDHRAGRHGLYLYTVGEQDRIRLTFIRRETFDEVNNTNPVITQQMSITSEDPQAAN
ncbi:unnamed protein product [Adineta ricciae]|uniref:Decapping nuclease n=1 Tax=Adineta ricciae TaxID=249248 RepID=A0A814EX96_ADIRI|nr:unnamed protein product [Adineta ricciae]CAF0977210.1 unnamed protein product [Adineta ricciae]